MALVSTQSVTEMSTGYISLR